MSSHLMGLTGLKPTDVLHQEYFLLVCVIFPSYTYNWFTYCRKRTVSQTSLLRFGDMTLLEQELEYKR